MICKGRWIIRGSSFLQDDRRGERGSRGEDRGGRGGGREREDRPERDNGPEPEFAPAFLTRDDD